MNRREFFALTAGAALGGVVAGAVANQLAPPHSPIVPACIEMRPELPGYNTAMTKVYSTTLFVDQPRDGYWGRLT